MSRDQVGWGQKVTRGPKKFKGKKDASYRVMILDEKAERRFTHYINGEYLVCLGAGCPACKVKKPSERFGFNILVYEMAEGFKVKEPVSYQILPWIVGYKMMRVLGDMYNMWGSFWNYDLKLTCTIEQFQEFMAQNMPEAVWEKVPGLKDTIMKDYQTKGMDVGSIMGRVVTASEMVEHMAKPDPFAGRDNGGTSQGFGSAPSRPARTFSKAEDSNLFGGGAQQVSNLVGGVVDSALAQASSTNHVLPGSPAAKAKPAPATVEIHGSTDPKSATPPKFPPPSPAADAPSTIVIVDKDPAKTAEPPVSEGYKDLVAKLKTLATKDGA